MHPLPALVCQYLDGDEVSREVLNDALEEIGRARSAVSGDRVDRMNAVLDHMLPEAIANGVALDFAENVSSICNNSRTSELLKEKRELLKTSANAMIRLQLSQTLHTLGWEADNSEKSHAIWAVWSAMIVAPKHVAAAARRASKVELDWQLERLKKIVLANL